MNYTIITGASKGIGKAMAIECAKRRMNLLLVARSLNELVSLKESLVASYGVDVDCIQLDLTDKKAGVFLKEYIETNDLSINCLINNAGVGVYGEFYRTNISKYKNMIQLNMAAVVEITHNVLPFLMQQPESYILNVASLGAFHAMPNMSLYAATKSFVKSFSDGLRQELKGDNINVTVLYPGPVSTNFTDEAGMQAYEKSNFKWLNVPVEKVAESAISGMLGGKKQIIPGWMIKIGFGMVQITPEWLLSRIMKRIFDDKQK